MTTVMSLKKVLVNDSVQYTDTASGEERSQFVEADESLNDSKQGIISPVRARTS